MKLKSKKGNPILVECAVCHGVMVLPSKPLLPYPTVIYEIICLGCDAIMTVRLHLSVSIVISQPQLELEVPRSGQVVVARDSSVDILEIIKSCSRSLLDEESEIVRNAFDEFQIVLVKTKPLDAGGSRIDVEATRTAIAEYIKETSGVKEEKITPKKPGCQENQVEEKKPGRPGGQVKKTSPEKKRSKSKNKKVARPKPKSKKEK